MACEDLWNMVGSGKDTSISYDIALAAHAAAIWRNLFVYFGVGLGLSGDQVLLLASRPHPVCLRPNSRV